MGSPSRKTPHTRLRRTESANRFQWTEELLELLGVLPDTGVAEKAGVHRLTVAAERRRRGIPPALSRRPPIEWTEEMIALLGTASDQAVAEALGVGRHSVKQKRQGLRIPPFHPPPHDKNQAYPWQPEDLARLGKVSDGTLARALGLNPTTVRTKRHSLGIAPFQPNPPAIEWTPAKIAQLGKSSDRRVAEELGISARSVLAKRLALGIPASLESHPVERNEQVAALLNLPNTEVIRRTGLTWATVQRLRKNLGVPEPTFQDLDPAASGEVDREHSTATEQAARVEALSGLPDDWRSHRAWQPEELALVGTAPDPEIAKRLNRTIEGVKSQRRKLRRVRRALRRWAAEEIELLGTATDPEVAERLGRSISAVRCKRSSLRIPDFLARGLRWQPHEIELLGAAPDQEIAERLGRSQQAVSEKRRKLGIPTFARVDPARRSIARERRLHAAREAKAHRRTDRSVNAAGRRPPLPATQALASRGAPIARRPPRHQTHWSEEHLSLLGEVPDAELARRMGVQPRTVGRERSRRGIPPFNRSPDVQWTPESIWLLGTDSDRRVAEELGIGAHSVTHKRLALGIPAANPQSRRLFPWNPEHVALLGALPDREVARRLGLSSATVARARRSRGIPPFVPAREAIRWTEEQLALLGTEPDRVLAEKLRTSPSTVRKKRNELGIPGRTDSRPVAVTPQLRQLLELPTNQVRRRTGLGAGTIKKLRDELGIRRLTVREWRTRLVEQRLGKVPDEALAEELGVSPNTVAQYRRDRGHYQTSHQRWTPEEDAMLGKLSDEEVARRTGHPLGSVSKRRRQLGHVRFRSRAWEPEEVALLGKLPDREVAKRIGRSLGAVRNKRYALGLPASETSAARVPPAFV